MKQALKQVAHVPKSGSVGVIGAGISGLSFAYFLSKLRPDINITIFESKLRYGGWIDTVELNNKGSPIRLEKGPRTLRGVSDGTLLILDTLIQNGAGDQIMVMKSSSVANRKFLLDSAYNMIPLPHSILSFITYTGSELSPRIASSLLKEPFRKKGELEDESIESFFQRRLGSTDVTDKVLSAVLRGIYGGDVGKLSVKSLFPRLQEFEQNLSSIIKPMLSSVMKSIFSTKKKEPEPVLPAELQSYQTQISPSSDLLHLKKSLKGFPIVALKDSLALYPKVIAEALGKNPKVKIVYNSKISMINPKTGLIEAEQNTEKFDHIRSTINVHQLSSLLNSQEFSKTVGAIKYVSIFMANVFSLNSNIIPKDSSGFGFLVPKSANNKEHLLGTIFDSEINSHVEPLNRTSISHPKKHTNMTLMLGGYMYDSGIPSDGICINSVKRSLSKVFGIDFNRYNIILRNEETESTKNLELNENDIVISYNLHKDCIPQYKVGYLQTKNEVGKILEQFDNKLSLGGMCFGRGVGVPDCVLNSLESALKL